MFIAVTSDKLRKRISNNSIVMSGQPYFHIIYHTNDFALKGSQKITQLATIMTTKTKCREPVETVAQTPPAQFSSPPFFPLPNPSQDALKENSTALENIRLTCDVSSALQSNSHGDYTR